MTRDFNYLEAKIHDEAEILPGEILLVDGFLNQGLALDCLDFIAEEFYRQFGQEKIDLVLTVEASGIAIAVATARRFGVNAAFAKKTRALNLGPDLHTVSAHSYTKQEDYTMALAKKILPPGLRVLLVDDFLAHGCAMQALTELVALAGAEVVGIGIAVEKSWQGGAERLERAGYRCHSVVRLKSLLPGALEFCD